MVSDVSIETGSRSTVDDGGLRSDGSFVGIAPPRDHRGADGGGDGMVGLGVVLSGMVVLRALGAADVAAAETDPQEHGFGAVEEALLTEGEVPPIAVWDVGRFAHVTGPHP